MQICICRISVEYKKLGDIATYINGYAFKPEQRGSEGLPIIRIQDLTGNAYDLGYYNGDYPKKIELNDGDVLISWSASLGVYLWNRGKALLNQHIFKVVFDKVEIDKFYFMYAVEYNLDKMSLKTHGATMKHITKKDFDNVVIPYPDLDYQKDISYRLTSLKRIIEKYQEQLDLLDELIKARFVEMFGDVQDAKKHSDKQLKDICNTVTGGTPSTKHAEYYNGTIPWVSTVSLGPNYIDGTTAKAFITQEAVDNSSTKIIPSGSILFGTRVGVGKSSINQVEMCTNQDIVAIIDLDESKYNKLYIKYVLDTYQSYFDSIKKGATILGISSDDLKNIYIPDASLYEQNRFEKFVKQIDKSRLLNNHSLLLLKSIIF